MKKQDIPVHTFYKPKEMGLELNRLFAHLADTAFFDWDIYCWDLEDPEHREQWNYPKVVDRITEILKEMGFSGKININFDEVSWELAKKFPMDNSLWKTTRNKRPVLQEKKK